MHLFGLPANMDPIMKLARAHNLKVIEDCAQALGARHNDRPVGSIGDVGCTSFYPSKNLAGFGDGGVITTNDDELADACAQLRNHGTSDGIHYPHVGGNFRLDALQAALLSIKLPHLDSWADKRREHANRYGQLLEEMPLGTPFEAEQRHHVYNQYTVRVHAGMRDGLQKHLDACAIGNRIYYPVPLHLQPCYDDLGYHPGSLPHAEEAADQVLSLPVFPEMTSDQQDAVVQGIREFFEGD